MQFLVTVISSAFFGVAIVAFKGEPSEYTASFLVGAFLLWAYNSWALFKEQDLV